MIGHFRFRDRPAAFGSKTIPGNGLARRKSYPQKALGAQDAPYASSFCDCRSSNPLRLRSDVTPTSENAEKTAGEAHVAGVSIAWITLGHETLQAWLPHRPSEAMLLHGVAITIAAALGAVSKRPRFVLFPRERMVINSHDL